MTFVGDSFYLCQNHPFQIISGSPRVPIYQMPEPASPIHRLPTWTSHLVPLSTHSPGCRSLVHLPSPPPVHRNTLLNYKSNTWVYAPCKIRKQDTSRQSREGGGGNGSSLSLSLRTWSTPDLSIQETTKNGFLPTLCGFPRWHRVKDRPAKAGDTREVGSIPGSGKSPGGGISNPLQYSGLKNPMDRGAWQATVHGVAKSWT